MGLEKEVINPTLSVDAFAITGAIKCSLLRNCDGVVQIPGSKLHSLTPEGPQPVSLEGQGCSSLLKQETSPILALPAAYSSALCRHAHTGTPATAFQLETPCQEQLQALPFGRLVQAETKQCPTLFPSP